METVLVTGIGGNVGYGAARCLRHAVPKAPIVGTNSVTPALGAYLCDQVEQVPWAHEDAYLDRMQEIVARHSVALILPCTDAEARTLSTDAARMVLPCAIATGTEAAGRLCFDKYLTYEVLTKNGLAFAESWLPGNIPGHIKLEDCIAKPRSGRGSRGIVVSPKSNLFDESYMLQKLYTGKETTTAAYFRQDGSLHGFCTMQRSLQNGATVTCQTDFNEDAFWSEYLQHLGEALGLRGSVNVQAIVDPVQGPVPFEINNRISGTASIRQHFGFRDVLYNYQEHIEKRAPDPVHLQSGCAVRPLAELVYLDQDLESISARSNGIRSL